MTQMTASSQPDSGLRSPEIILNDIESIDVSMIDIRFKSPHLTNFQILDKLSELIEERNRLADELSKAKAKEFHAFIDSLNLPEIQICPFYPVPRRCKLQLNNPTSGELIKVHESETNNPWKKMLSSYIKKKEEEHNTETKVALAMLQTTQQRIIAEKKVTLQDEIQRLSKKPILSPTDLALKIRWKSELEELEKYELGRRRK